MIASSKTWAGSATHMWTRCPRQAWPHSSLTTKQYYFWLGTIIECNKALCISHMISSYEGTSSPWTSQSVAWCARNTYRMEVANLTIQCILRTCMTDLGWFQRKQKQSFSDPRRQLTPSARELEKVTSFIRTYTSWMEHEGNVYKSFQH